MKISHLTHFLHLEFLLVGSSSNSLCSNGHRFFGESRGQPFPYGEASISFPSVFLVIANSSAMNIPVPLKLKYQFFSLYAKVFFFFFSLFI